ncbi:MAG: YbaK/EbsC family protein [Clostridiales bacterium]|nr:YbaK/EbsC family protein [Clostridiales bacterium]MDO4350613.1 YbaK/EbsC family protein [Eubacteriales bacterium]MDY4009134.1 YbaK/EbsC family protein [Candidatus Limiplasma sp.]
MTIDQIKTHLEACGLHDRVKEFDQSSATVELAVQAVGCEPCRIAKTMSFLVDGGVALIVLAGDARVDNQKFKAAFHQKAKMLTPDEVAGRTGFPVGGVCPFLAPEGTKVYLDVSLKRFDTVYPAAGTCNSAVRLTPQELERAAAPTAWIDVSRG